MNAAPTAPLNWVSALILFLGPVLGPFSLLVFGAFIGALLALGKEELNEDRWAGARFVIISMGVSLVLSGLAMWMVTKYTEVPADLALMPVAALLAAGRQYLMGVVQKVMNAVGDFLAGLFAKKG